MEIGEGMSYLQSKSQLNKDFPYKIFRYFSHLLKQSLHIHDYIQIAYVLIGRCNHQFRGKSLTVSRGDFFIIASGIEHSFSSIEDNEFELVLIDFLPLLYPPEDTELVSSMLQPWLHIGKSKQLLFEHLLQDIQDEFEHREIAYEYSIRITLAKLLLLIDREYRKAKRKPARQPALTDQQPMDEVKRYINDNYSQDIPLEHGAFIANMAPVYFSHVC